MTSQWESCIVDNVAIYGGAFDPTTLAHIEVAEVVYQQTGMPVWMMPCYSHKFGKKLTSPICRLRMVELAAKGHSFITPFPYEIYVQHAGSMYDTLVALSKIHVTKKFHLVMGMDNANDIEKWYMYEKLLKEFACIVIMRKGCPIQSEWWYKYPHSAIRLETELSSTDVRDAIAAGNNEWAQKAVPPRVWEYIKTHSLFGYKDIA